MALVFNYDVLHIKHIRDRLGQYCKESFTTHNSQNQLPHTAPILGGLDTTQKIYFKLFFVGKHLDDFISLGRLSLEVIENWNGKFISVISLLFLNTWNSVFIRHNFKLLLYLAFFYTIWFMHVFTATFIKISNASIWFLLVFKHL